jgi:membrane glycosyltransferase
MQYWRLLSMPGLRTVSRVQLALAMLMFIGSPAWIAFMTLGILSTGFPGEFSMSFHPQTGLALLVAVMTMVFAPKLATVLDALASSRTRRAFGGGHRILLGLVAEVFFATLIAPVMALAHTRFLAGMPFGRAAIWSAQRRSTHRVSYLEALRRLWPQTLFGAGAMTWLAAFAPAAAVGFLPFVLGALLAVPIAVTTSGEGAGARLARMGLWRIPDETAPASELLALHLPVLRDRRPPSATGEPATGAASIE